MPTPESRTGAGRRHRLLAAQEGIWAGQQLDTGSPAYNTAEYVRVHGPVDTAVFDTALHLVVAETEALNATFVPDSEGRPWQVDTPAGDWRTHIADLTAEPRPLAAALTWMDQDLARPVDLARGPIFGHALLRTGEAEYLWYHRVHHIALDGFGLSLVARRVAEVYTVLVSGESVPASGFGTLESVRTEEHAYRTSARHTEDGAYWRGRYADRPPVASPAGRPALPSRTVHRHVADLGPDRAASLREVARDLSSTWSEIVLAVTAAHLHRVTGAAEIVLSLPAMGRLGSVSLRVPAMVRNILPLRVPVDPGDSLRDLAARVSRELRAGLPHQRYRYERLRRDLRLVGGRRRLSGPGVNIMPFQYDLRFAGHRSSVHNVSAGPVDDLALNVYDRGDGTGLRVALDANPDLYESSDTETLLHGVLALLDEATAAPGTPLRELAVGRPDALSAGASAPAVVLDGGPLPVPARPVLSLIADHAACRGTAVAVEHAGERVTYAQLYGTARTIARRLSARGVGRGDLVAVALPRGPEAVAAVLGVLLSGAAYCPLDPSAPADRTARLLADTTPALVLTTDAHRDAFGHVPLLQLPVLDRPDDEPYESPPPASADLAYVLHTSGSTGRPKGVEIAHRALAHFVAGALHCYGIRPDDRVLQFAPLHFDTSVEEIFVTLCAGATLVVRTDDMTESVRGFLADCARRRVTVLDLPTAYWHEVAHAVAGGATLPGSVRTVLIGGEAALPERVTRWREAVGTRAALLNTYGPTEATVVATVADLYDETLAPGDVPIGRPLPGTRAAVVEGELYLLGDHLAEGYRGDRLPDNARFGPLAQVPGRPRAYRTGDLVRIGGDGQLRFLGRADAEFKISGHRVHPAEVENALLAHSRIREAAVVGQTLPDGGRRLIAHLVREAPVPSAAEIRDHVRRRLPAALIPSELRFLDRLPRTDSGKIDRTVLAADPNSPSSTPDPDGTGPLERTITGVWQRILGVGTITADDDVFDLGAQSLQVIQAANRLGTVLGREVRVGRLFQYPTAAELARFLGEETRPAPASALPTGLLRDAVLDPAVRPGARRRPGVPERILLTGATGFVGAHLLAELLDSTRADLICTVRARDVDEAAARIRAALDRHGITPTPEQRRRVTALPADLALPRLGLTPEAFDGLAATCDAIFHNGATVSILREYGTLRAANTESTRQLLLMSAAHGTPLHYVSTLSVAPPAVLSAEVTEAFLAAHEGLRYGYQQSKWASERLLEQAAERGLPVTVHRLGRVVGPASTGHVNEQDFLWGVLRAGIPAGIVPELFEDEIWTPVDFVARALVHLCLVAPPAAAGPVFHYATTPRVRLGDLYDWVEEYGYPLRRLTLADWRARLPVSPGVAATTLAFFDAQGSGRAGGLDLRLGHVHADNVRRGLADSGIVCPPVGRDLVFRYLDHCVTAGLLPAPAPEHRHGVRSPTPADSP
ncbi:MULTISPECIES: amino acid adenylation domain-containing protein [unclassified Streptomyces]|uniref:amino acid adenylation domain-containing protein n=1 Tax=unclassified Streptomyces TaxID=2593676 RepID=UPI0035D7AD4C